MGYSCFLKNVWAEHLKRGYNLQIFKIYTLNKIKVNLLDQDMHND